MVFHTFCLFIWIRSCWLPVSSKINFCMDIIPADTWKDQHIKGLLDHIAVSAKIIMIDVYKRNSSQVIGYAAMKTSGFIIWKAWYILFRVIFTLFILLIVISYAMDQNVTEIGVRSDHAVKRGNSGTCCYEKVLIILFMVSLPPSFYK